LFKKLLTAAEIAHMRLPGLPTTKANVLARAEKERWPYEQRSGIGGTRKVFDVPVKYLPPPVVTKTDSRITPLPVANDIRRRGQIVGTIAAGTSKVDKELMAIALQALEEFAQERGLTVQHERKGAILAFLYNYLADGGDIEDATELMRAINGD
jgi:hypothetical protein